MSVSGAYADGDFARRSRESQEVDGWLATPVDGDFVEHRVEAARAASGTLGADERRLLLLSGIPLIDLSSPTDADARASVSELCEMAAQPVPEDASIPPVAAVCVRSGSVAQAIAALEGTGVLVAASVGGPQSSLKEGLLQLEEALDAGADEVDVPLSVALMLSGEEGQAERELSLFRERCHVPLKVALEAGPLAAGGGADIVRRASFRAMRAGADLICASTAGPESPGPAASPSSGAIMLDAVRDYEETTGRAVGLRMAGDLRTAEDLLTLLLLAREGLGEGFTSPDLLRISASRPLPSLARGLSQDMALVGTQA
jgi:deoxyribose-phosphate aldolase